MVTPMSVEEAIEPGLIYDNQHIVWVGCGDMCRRSFQALTALEDGGASLTFLDIHERDDVKQIPPPKAKYFNIANPLQQLCRRHLCD